MFALRLLSSLALLSLAFGQHSEKIPRFDVASVKPSSRTVGPDYNNQLTYSPAGITARNVTLRRLVAEAYRLQVSQVLGPNWLDQNEYDIEARTTEVPARDTASMLRGLLAERFRLKQHSETRDMNLYELVAGKSGPKIQPVKEGENVKAGTGFHFRGDLRAFADFLAVQLSIPAANSPDQPARAAGPPTPVVDKTSLSGIYDFSVDVRPEMGMDMLPLWQRALEEHLGMNIQSRKGKLEVLVVDDAARVPTGN